ncbi:hypothetical protein pb186bvf_010426 [Paramecium bursaria]
MLQDMSSWNKKNNIFQPNLIQFNLIFLLRAFAEYFNFEEVSQQQILLFLIPHQCFHFHYSNTSKKFVFIF